MSGLVSVHARHVFEAPFRVPDARESVGDALWLYLRLALAANFRGIASRRLDRLAEESNASAVQIEASLSQLASVGLIEILSPAPFLVIKLRSWSGNGFSKRDEAPQNRSGGSTPAIDVPVRSSSAAAAPAINSNGEDGGQGEGEALLREIVEVLGHDADADEIRPLIQRLPVELVRRAIRRVQTTPDSEIRKSKLALFRYLLQKLA